MVELIRGSGPRPEHGFLGETSTFHREVESRTTDSQLVMSKARICKAQSGRNRYRSEREEPRRLEKADEAQHVADRNEQERMRDLERLNDGAGEWVPTQFH
ncbi:hypothetical protein FA13DRAFT_1715989 [Coprinellus micaceus]|uniref:Uncharacterized protein n=1 Tax=Coprinellus micaceus TaxID=71717 RepID=A0A4Y7SLU8_COPMI|nr:hypothetical protein FA13DRAFT_1715989 [Coprinellus micaceus]